MTRSRPNNTMKSEVYSGRPLRMIKNPYIVNWDTERKEEMKELLDNGTIPFKVDFDINKGIVKNDKIKELGFKFSDFAPHLSGQVAGSIDNIPTAKHIIDDMMNEAMQVIRNGNMAIVPYRSKL